VAPDPEISEIPSEISIPNSESRFLDFSDKLAHSLQIVVGGMSNKILPICFGYLYPFEQINCKRLWLLRDPMKYVEVASLLCMGQVGALCISTEGTPSTRPVEMILLKLTLKTIRHIQIVLNCAASANHVCEKS